MKYSPQKYLNFGELTSFLNECAKEFPNLCSLESVGKAPEGRDIWLLTVTNQKTGAASEKPAYWVDGNIHAVELAGCQACVHLIHRCLTQYGKDAGITRLLDEQTFYIVPRVSPDGAELSLTTESTVRSSPLEWPYVDSLPGLYPKDMDGNGFIGLMRRPNPSGAWRVSKNDPRIMLIREPDEYDPNGTYYDLITEGEIEGFDGHEIQPRVKAGLDLNRQFPADWMPEGEQAGAGPFPLSQPETRAIVEAISSRPNIVGLQSFHTFSGVILRPLANKPDSEMDHDDLMAFKAIGKRGREITGYPDLSVFHDFKYHPKMDFGGGFFEWAYIHRGIIGFTNEIWHIAKKAGIEIKDHIDLLFNQFPEDELLKLFKWCDENLESGTWFQPWKPFKHPQLGDVEIGGWKHKFTWNNPPVQFLEEELNKNVECVLSFARCNPRVKVKESGAQNIEGTSDIRKISLKIENCGYLPTYGTKRALATGAIRKPRVKLRLSEGQSLIDGKADFEIEHLTGRANHNLFHRNPVVMGMTYFTPFNSNETTLNWVVKGKGNIEVEAQFDRAGVVRAVFD